MTNEEILANAPKDGGATHILVDHEHHVTYAKRYPDSGNWFWFHPDSGWLEFDRMPTAQNIQSLSGIRRIVELESELDKVYNDLANFEGYPEEVSALRRDIERRKQRYLNLLNKRKEWKKRAEAAERERNDKELKITVLETLLSNLWPGNYKPMDAVAVEITEALRQQLNGGE